MKRFITIGLLAFALISNLSCFESDDSDPADPPVTTMPAVISTIPADLGTGLALNAGITATFNMEMDPLTIDGTTFTVMQGVTPVAGTVMYSGVIALFKPTSNLAASTIYTATITTGAKDLSGNALPGKYVWSFTTGLASDIIPPTVSSTIPANNATGVALNSNITATFSEGMDHLTITSTTFTLKQGATPVAGAVSYVGAVATFNPTVDLAASTVYTATITTNVKDLAGNAMASNHVWSFTTGLTVPDIIPPTVISTIPANNATGVALNSNITATFSEGMDHLTITGTTFTLKQGATPVAGAVSYAGVVATFNPTVDLAANTVYTATITTDVKDPSGNAMIAVKTWSFTTIAANPAVVNLGTTSNFVILATTGISNVSTSGITGNIGVSPIDSSAITGFTLTMDSTGDFSTTPEVIGKVYAANYANFTPSILTGAVLNMGTAYVDAAGRVTPDFTELGSGNIGGMTLSRGLYKWGTAVSIASDITLNGSATDVWIFQIADTLTLASGVKVHLTGGALAKNIFWQVGAAADAVTLNTTSHLEGIVLSATTIALKTGATVNGRLLSQTAVTLEINTVTQPTP